MSPKAKRCCRGQSGARGQRTDVVLSERHLERRARGETGQMCKSSAFAPATCAVKSRDTRRRAMHAWRCNTPAALPADHTRTARYQHASRRIYSSREPRVARKGTELGGGSESLLPKGSRGSCSDNADAIRGNSKCESSARSGGDVRMPAWASRDSEQRGDTAWAREQADASHLPSS